MGLFSIKIIFLRKIIYKFMQLSDFCYKYVLFRDFKRSEGKNMIKLCLGNKFILFFFEF